MEGGELFERIVKKARYSELEARECVKTILETMAYLHKRNIAHRDLKPENLLLTSMDDDGDIKVADFGFAKHIQTDIEDDGGGGLDTQCGTPGYVAPEILMKQKYAPPQPTQPLLAVMCPNASHLTRSWLHIPDMAWRSMFGALVSCKCNSEAS